MLQYNKNLLHIKKAAGYTPPTPPIPDPSYYVIGDFTGGGAPAGWSVGGGGGGGVGYGGGGVYSIDGSPVTLRKSNMPSLENAYMVEIVVNCSIKSMTDTLTIALRTGTTDNYTGTKGTNGTSPQLRSFFRDGSITSNTSGTLVKGEQSVKATIVLEDKDELLQGSTLSNMGVNLSHNFSNITNAMNYVRNSDNLYVTFSGETIINSIDMYVYVRQPTPPTPISDDYFCITAAENGSVALNKYGTPTDVDIEISSDKTSWSDYTFGDGISLNTGEKVYFRNKSETQTGFSTKTPDYVGSLDGGDLYYFSATNNIYATGDVNSLVCRDPSLVTTLGDYCFTGLFWENTKLLSFEKLPSTYLGDWCYCAMFEGCTALTYTPTLPATTVGFNTYASMFRNCTSLTIAPALPATTLGRYCYFYMFGGCTSLTRASTLPATTLNIGCYQGMFSGCTALTTAPSLPATTLANQCYYYMFVGCTALTIAPSLPATTLADYCYYYMFGNCTSLITAPSLSTTTLAYGCYAYMFYGCTSLDVVPVLPATTLATNCYRGMFCGCTSLRSPAILNATTLADYCYEDMFFGCTNIKLSETQTGEYQLSYRIPTTGTGVEGTDSCIGMFTDTGGTFTGTPSINTTYYLSNGLTPIVTTPGIYHNASLGLISLSPDGTNWMTLADKNLGATQVWNYGDSLTETNSGYYYQRGNNYGFSSSNLSDIPKAPTPVDATGYGPGNYYNNNLIACGYSPIYTPNNDMRGYNAYLTDYDYTWIQGPCPSGFHLPLPTDFNDLIDYWVDLTNLPEDSVGFSSLLKMPLRGMIGAWSTSNVGLQYVGMAGDYRGCYSYLYLYYSFINNIQGNSNSGLHPIRPFKNTPVIPDSTWTILYQPSS